ncbi:terpenoid synthase [Trametes polyzona]|nr:terpenoid synthase [Trametes polyzona]
MAQQYIYLPDFMGDWPWPRRIHPLHEEVAVESRAWVRSAKPFTPESQASFERCNFELLGALAYPDASRDGLRVGMDLMNLLFVIDEYTDVEVAPAVQEAANVVMDALRNPQKPRPDGEVILGEITRQYAERALRAATPEAMAHFRDSFSDYLDAVVSQADERDGATVRSVDDFIRIRRENNGGRPALFPCELHLSIPDEAFYHPQIVELRNCIVDMVTTMNDITSYNREQATNADDYNLLTVVMHRHNTDLSGAIAWVTDFHNEIVHKFIEGLKHVPSFGLAVDSQLQEYLENIANWPRSQDSWTFESGRYFGDRGMEYMTTRRVALLKRRDPKLDAGCCREQVRVHLIEGLVQSVVA